VSSSSERQARIQAASERLHASRLALHQWRADALQAQHDAQADGRDPEAAVDPLGALLEPWMDLLGEVGTDLSQRTLAEWATWALARLGDLGSVLAPAVKRHPILSLGASFLTAALMARRLLRRRESSAQRRTHGPARPGRHRIEALLANALWQSVSKGLLQALGNFLAEAPPARPAKPTDAASAPEPTPPVAAAEAAPAPGQPGAAATAPKTQTH
jgi:hypothetical protein